MCICTRTTWTRRASNSLEAYVDRTNAMLHDIAQLNRQILDASSMPGQPNDLLDRRDLVMDDLSNIAGVTVTIMDNGAARVSLDGPLPLSAEITVGALLDLELRPGDDVHATVKAVDIEVSPA